MIELTEDTHTVIFKHKCSKHLGVLTPISKDPEEIERHIRCFCCDHTCDDITWLLFKGDDKVVPEDPAGRYQSAWEFDDDDNPTKININLDIARKIKMDMLRWQRGQILVRLDKMTFRYITNPEKLAEIEESKQALRDTCNTAEVELEKRDSFFEIISLFPNAFVIHDPEYSTEMVFDLRDPNAQIPSKMNYLTKQDALTKDIEIYAWEHQRDKRTFGTDARKRKARQDGSAKLGRRQG